jgi:hypothetical protein
MAMAMAMAMEQQPQQQHEEEEERFVTDLANLRISFTLFIRIYHPTRTTSPYSSLYSGISLFQSSAHFSPDPSAPQAPT